MWLPFGSSTSRRSIVSASVKRQVALVDLVERAGRRVVPHPRAAVADALVEQHLVVEPAAELALGIVERDPERLGLVRVVAHRVELSSSGVTGTTSGLAHPTSSGQPRSYIAARRLAHHPVVARQPRPVVQQVVVELHLALTRGRRRARRDRPPTSTGACPSRRPQVVDLAFLEQRAGCGRAPSGTSPAGPRPWPGSTPHGRRPGRRCRASCPSTASYSAACGSGGASSRTSRPGSSIPMASACAVRRMRRCSMFMTMPLPSA